MNEILKTAIQNGELVLFLGAGASKSCSTAKKENTLDGANLAKELAKRAGLTYEDEPLDEVYTAVRGQLNTRLDPILMDLFRHTIPSLAYITIARHAWRRIYTLNIDDGLDKALQNSSQRIYIRLSTDPIEDRDQFFEKLDYIKLNGSIDRLKDGIIFSAAEYAKATLGPRPWYEQCASDFVRSPFLFIGTKLNEPLLKYHIERYKNIHGSGPGVSFVITPTATDIQKKSLAEYNIVHIAGTLEDFTDWLNVEFPDPITSESLAFVGMPQYRDFLNAPDKYGYASLLEGVTVVNRDMFVGEPSPVSAGAVRPFYKGYKPTWNDIVDGVPAELEIFDSSFTTINSVIGEKLIVPLVGPAGSGKTTLLMQLCYKFSSDPHVDVYFIDEPLEKLSKTLESLEKSAAEGNRVLVGIDNIEFSVDQLADIAKAGRLKNTQIIFTTRENIWQKRVKPKLSEHAISPIYVREFSRHDAENILEKLKTYGSWTILGQMPAPQRIDALVVRAKQQLLIALLEATFGVGFHQIIESDYASLSTEEEQLFLLTVGVITDRNFDGPVALVDRALNSLGILPTSITLSQELSGIVTRREGKLAVRHQIYVRHLLEHVVDPSLTAKAISGLLNAFAHYRPPIIKHLTKAEAAIYKGIINHRFLWDVLKGRETLIIPLYRNLEKSFELDGLFWLQYGLALRDFHNNGEALEKLRTAYAAYSSNHTQHALGHQLLIVAEETADKTAAMNFVDEARDLLESLDDVIDSDDTYPIVTLAEGHTKVVRRVLNEGEAKVVAKSYLPQLKQKQMGVDNSQRISIVYEKLFRFVTTGTWYE